MLFGHRAVAVPPTPLTNPPQRTAEANLGRLAPHDPTSRVASLPSLLGTTAASVFVPTGLERITRQPGLFIARRPRRATLGSGWWPTFAGSGLSPAGSLRRFPSCVSLYTTSPSPRLCLAQRISNSLPKSASKPSLVSADRAATIRKPCAIWRFCSYTCSLLS